MPTVNWYSLAADAVVLVHLGFVLFVLLGGLLVWWQRWWLWLHLPALVWGILIEIAGWICPLTYLENYLRTRAMENGYETGFIEHYIMPVLYPANLTRELQWVLALFVIVINCLIYYRVWRVSRRPN